MSLYASMNTAISGMSAQSRALGHIADNVANSQTTGFKRTDTNFVSFISESNADIHRPGTVLARPDFTNQVQGTIEQVENPLSMAISGQGLFSAALPVNKNVDGTVTFDPRTFYTRAGDFSRNSEGYLVNGAGYALQGWPVTDGVVEKTKLVPIQIAEDVFTPTPSKQIDFAGNLAAGGTTAQSASIQIIDSLGFSRMLTLTFTPTTATNDNTWALSIVAPAAATYTGAPAGTPAGTLGTVTVEFGQDPTDPAFDQPVGTLARLASATGTVTTPTNANMVKDKPAQITFKANFGQGDQTLTLDLGKFGVAGGLTQFAPNGPSDLSVSSFEQDGIPLGAFSSVTTQKNGDIQVNYDNGQSRVVARIPITIFKDADRLEHLDGQAFLRTTDSGEARVVEVGTDGAGLLTTRAVERSNVDIATEFSKLIQAQRAYSANTRLVTTVDELLQETLNIRR